MWVQPKHYKIIGAELAEARKRAKITQEDLAQKLGKPQSFVSNYERGERRVDVLEFLRIVDAIGGDAASILGQVAKSITRSKR